MLRPLPFAPAPAGKTRSRAKQPTIYGYARVSTGGQSVAEQVRQLRAAGAVNVFREVASGAAIDRPQLRRLLSVVAADDAVMVTRLDQLARSTRDLLNTLAAIGDRKAGFRSLADVWADTTTAHGRLMLTVLAGLADDAESVVMRSDAARTHDTPGFPWCSAPHNPAVRRGLHVPAAVP